MVGNIEFDGEGNERIQNIQNNIDGLTNKLRQSDFSDGRRQCLEFHLERSRQSLQRCLEQGIMM